VEAGLDSALLDPLDGRLMGAILATELVLDRDCCCRAYTQAYKAGAFPGVLRSGQTL
jgi:5-methyltetrahydrofolate--homocysteine methyltransferase